MRRLPFALIICVFALNGLSLWTLASFELTSFMNKQVIFSIIGSIISIGIMFIPYRYIQKVTYPSYYILCILLIFLLIAGTPIKGVVRWISLAGITIQPSEFVKLGVILILARELSKPNLQGWKSGLKIWSLVLLPLGLILIQPDLGTALILVPIGLGTMYVAGMRKEILLPIFILLGVFPLLYLFVLKDYQRERIKAFLDPDSVSEWKNYQQRRAIIAIGAGKFSGYFLSHTTVDPEFVPVRHSDFIFSAIGERWGFIGSSLVIVLFIIFFTVGISKTDSVTSPFGRYLVTGVMIYLATHVIINIGMNIGLLPIAGLPLPFISCGGSSTITNYMALGIILNAYLQRPRVWR
jgi:rod shape determining protein RodA